MGIILGIPLQIIATIFTVAYYAIIIQFILQVLFSAKILSKDIDQIRYLKNTLDRFLNPAFAKIREYIKPINGIDFSPLILIIILKAAVSILFKLYYMI